MILLLLAIAILVGSWKLWGLFKSTSEHNVEHYLSTLQTDGLTKIGIYGLGEQVELHNIDAQMEILNYLSRLKADMGAEGSNTKALGAVIFDIKLFYADGSVEILTIPAFKYPTILGEKDFYLSPEGEYIWAPFVQYFKLLQS